MNDELRDSPATPPCNDEPDVTMVDGGDRSANEDPDFDDVGPQERDRDA